MSKKKYVDYLIEGQAAPLSKYWEQDLPNYSNPAADIIAWRGDGELDTKMKSKDLDSVVDKIMSNGSNVKKPKTVGSSMKNVAEDGLTAQERMDLFDLLEDENFGIGYSTFEEEKGFEDIESILELADTAHGPAFKAKSQQLQDDLDKKFNIKDGLGKKKKNVSEKLEIPGIDEDEFVQEHEYDFDFGDDADEDVVTEGQIVLESAPIQYLEESETDDLDSITSLIREMNELEREIEETVNNDDYDDDDDDAEEEDDDDSKKKGKRKGGGNDSEGEDDDDDDDDSDDDGDSDGGLSESFLIDLDEDIFED
jgi:hypothetical protein